MGYKQIRMRKEDERKTVFITELGTFCYQVLSFGLKNASAMFHKLMNKIFKDQIGRNVEIYDDDILVKSKMVANHLADLIETFAILHKVGLKPKDEICAFGVIEDKFLGHMSRVIRVC